MMKSSENGPHDHGTGASQRSEDLRCHSQRSMGRSYVLVVREPGQESAQVPLIEHNDLVQSLLP